VSLGSSGAITTTTTTTTTTTIVVVVVVVVVIIIISFTQGIHTYISETNRVSRVHSVAAIPRVLLMVHIALSAILNSFVVLH
jgi:hypothetical protein